MTNRKTTKRALISSLLALLICCTMLVGTTFAWFTDNEVLKNNVIKAGTLDIELDEETVLFSSESLWEPGYSEPFNTEVQNIGNLWLKYQLKITNLVVTDGAYSPVDNDAVANNPDGSNIATVLDVYAGTASVVDDKTVINGTYLGTVADLFADESALLEGVLAPAGAGDATYDEADALDLVVKMKEEAGNEYQNDSITFDISVLATQYTYEEDGFENDQYDADAEYDIPAYTAADLDKAAAAGGSVALETNIAGTKLGGGNKALVVAEGKTLKLDLNGKSFASKDADSGANSMAIYVSRGATLIIDDTVGGGSIDASCYGIYVQPGATLIMNGGTINVSGNGRYDYGVILWNGTFIMNGGTINAKAGIVPSNYWKENGEPEAPVNSITLNGGIINATNLEIDLKDAADAIVNDNR